MSIENTDKNLIRLNKLIAERGLASRRGADKLIADGQVTVNGKKVYELGIKVNPNQDSISIDGTPLRSKNQNLYIMFNKPKNVITSMTDPLDRPTVADYMNEVPGRVFPIGRLDWDSEGLILMTNDGEFANKVMHPSKEVTKTYHVKLDGQPRPDQIAKLYNGVSIPEGGKVKAKHVEKIKMSKSKDQKTSKKYDWYKIVITEGKNHQVREMFKKIGYDVMKLQRVAIGKLRLGQLETGDLVYLNDGALDRVFMADLPTEAHPKKDFRPKSTKKVGPVAKNNSKNAKSRGGAIRGPVKKAKEESPSRKKFLSKLAKMK
jgi:23S rRNA pseudouridine2605 synthase